MGAIMNSAGLCVYLCICLAVCPRCKAERHPVGGNKK